MPRPVRKLLPWPGQLVPRCVPPLSPATLLEQRIYGKCRQPAQVGYARSTCYKHIPIFPPADSKTDLSCLCSDNDPQQTSWSGYAVQRIRRLRLWR